MSIFHFPRINFKGLIAVNVGTANNDDYSGDQFPPGSPYQGQPLRLGDSKNVQPAGLDPDTGLVYGMTDAQWVEWVQTPGNFQKSPSSGFTKQRSESAHDAEAQPTSVPHIPGEWNFYGDMGMTMIGTKVIGVTDPGKQIPPDLLQALYGAELSFNNRPDETGRSTGMLIDVNPEDATNSQVFTDFLSLKSSQADRFLFSGKPTKAATRWINFQRNTMLSGPNGAAATFQCAIPLSELQGQDILKGMPAQSPDGLPLIGIVCRYVLYRSLQKINTFKYAAKKIDDPWFSEMTQLYAQKGINPTYVQVQGTIAPWFAGEPASCPVGRQLLPGANVIPLPSGSNGNGSTFSLAPAVAYLNKAQNLLSIDFASSFPDAYQGTTYDPMQTDNNPKFNFGQVAMAIQPSVGSPDFQNFADVLYFNTDVNDGMGWIFDIPVESRFFPMLENSWLAVTSPGGKPKQILLQESPYLIVSDQSALYADQGGAGSTTSAFFNEDGLKLTPTSFLAYKKGTLVKPTDPDRFTLYYYDSTPNQAPGPLTLLQNNYASGNAITFPTDGKGNRLITATYPGDPYPPAGNYAGFAGNVSPLINLRILPNDRDYSQYYVPGSNPPVGNAQLTFDVMYNEVLRNYYLLYPAMSLRIPLNDPSYWTDAEMAGRLMQRISLEFWGKAEAMPRTRDLSESRRTLITAWCLKFFQPAPGQPPA